MFHSIRFPHGGSKGLRLQNLEVQSHEEILIVDQEEADMVRKFGEGISELSIQDTVKIEISTIP